MLGRGRGGVYKNIWILNPSSLYLYNRFQMDSKFLSESAETTSRSDIPFCLREGFDKRESGKRTFQSILDNYLPFLMCIIFPTLNTSFTNCASKLTIKIFYPYSFCSVYQQHKDTTFAQFVRKSK